MNDAHVVWLTADGPETEFEKEFLESLFDGSGRRLSFGVNGGEPCDVAVVAGAEPALPRRASELLDTLRPDVLVHLADEGLETRSAAYQPFGWVIRSYYNPLIRNGRVHAIPLGYKSGFGSEPSTEADRRLRDRDLTWTFVGSSKSDRPRMAKALSKVPNHFIHWSDEWGGFSDISVEDMRALYGRTVFAPCPRGWVNPDSYRVMEALECGCIPVVVAFYGLDVFEATFGDHPFVVARSWSAAAASMQSLLADPAALRERQLRTSEWYATFRAQLRSDVDEIVAGRSPSSTQARFQAEHSRNLRWRATFVLHFRVRHPMARVTRRIKRRAYRLLRPLLGARGSAP